MTLKTEVFKFIHDERKLTYPYLGFAEQQGLYVLFIEPRKGFVVFDVFDKIGKNTRPVGRSRVGEYSDRWCEEDYFTYTKDKVTIENEDF
jgi:hypothetical protein